MQSNLTCGLFSPVQESELLMQSFISAGWNFELDCTSVWQLTHCGTFNSPKELEVNNNLFATRKMSRGFDRQSSRGNVNGLAGRLLARGCHQPAGEFHREAI